MIQSSFDGISFRFLSWADCESLTRTLAQKVLESGQEYDRIIAIANGGLSMARLFGDLIDLKTISILQTTFYKSVAETEPKPQLLQPLAVDITDERVLIFEDIVDTGATLEFIEPLLQYEQNVAHYDVASLVVKSHSRVRPTYSAAEWNEWIIYPYEIRESIQALSERWQRAGLEADEIVDRLATVGFIPADITAYSVG